ncbi:MAG: serine/threonine protein kinase [Anaerolineae bacterium]|nr:serine/threonine protein kinase [Anaerolineae bacterium]
MLARGTTLRNRYRIIETIGQGGMGSVYLAEDLRLEGRKCALKAVRIDPNTDPQLISELQHQFSREASILAQLDHPNLPKVSDYFTDNALDYLVMDYVAGKNLKEIMDEARRNDRFLVEVEVLNWAKQLCDALEYLHTQATPVLHRDIKPSNIKLAPSGLIKLVDFGLVKVMVRDDSRTITVLQGRGTAAYTPMEQYGEDDIHTDVRSDIYSLGATLYHLCSNQQPPEARQRFLKPASLMPLRQANATISEQTERAIHAAIAMHPDDRPTSVAEFRELLLGSKAATNRLSAEVGPTSEQEYAALVNENLPWVVTAGVATVIGFFAALTSR